MCIGRVLEFLNYTARRFFSLCECRVPGRPWYLTMHPSFTSNDNMGGYYSAGITLVFFGHLLPARTLNGIDSRRIYAGINFKLIPRRLWRRNVKEKLNSFLVCSFVTRNVFNNERVGEKLRKCSFRITVSNATRDGIYYPDRCSFLLSISFLI